MEIEADNSAGIKRDSLADCSKDSTSDTKAVDIGGDSKMSDVPEGKGQTEIIANGASVEVGETDRKEIVEEKKQNGDEGRDVIFISDDEDDAMEQGPGDNIKKVDNSKVDDDAELDDDSYLDDDSEDEDYSEDDDIMVVWDERESGRKLKHLFDSVHCPSNNPVMQQIFKTHYLVFFMNNGTTTENSTMASFLQYYLSNFMEPTGWTAEWWRTDNSNIKPLYQWPRPKYLAGVVHVEDVDCETLTVTGKYISHGTVKAEDKRGEICGESVVLENIPLYELVPLGPTVEGCILGLYALKEGLEGLRLLKDHMILPSFDDLTAQIFFEGQFSRVENLFHDLETPGCLTNKIRNHIIDLLCTARRLMDPAEESNDTDSEADESEDSGLKSLHFNQILSRAAYELKLLLVPEVRKETDYITEYGSRNGVEICDNTLSEVFVVSEKNCFQFSEILKVKSILAERKQEFKIENTEQLAFSTDLVRTLQNCRSNAIVFVTAGKYDIPSIGALASGGFLIGLVDEEGNRPKIGTHGTGDVWNVLSTNDSVCNLEDLSLEISDGYAEQIMTSAFTITSGKLRLLNCEIESTSFKKSTSNAGVYQQLSMIDVRGGDCVAILGCIFKGARCVVNQGPTSGPCNLFMKDCKIDNVVHFLNLQGAKGILDLEDLTLFNVDNPNLFSLECPKELQDSADLFVQIDTNTSSIKRLQVEYNHILDENSETTPTTPTPTP